MPINNSIIEKIANDTGLSDITELNRLSLISYLTEKKRKIKMDILDIFKRYNVSAANELNEKITIGTIDEHPAWEDYIFLENLKESLSIIEEDIRTLQ